MSIALKEIKRKILREGGMLSMVARSWIYNCPTQRDLEIEVESLHNCYHPLYKSDAESPLFIYNEWKKKRDRIAENKKYDLRTDKMPDDCCLGNPYSYPQFNGVYYAYVPGLDEWFIYENFYFGHLMIFDGDRFRLDECLQMYFKQHKR